MTPLPTRPTSSRIINVDALCGCWTDIVQSQIAWSSTDNNDSVDAVHPRCGPTTTAATQGGPVAWRIRPLP
eukprot:5482820-Pyramimonas_sp.AAC.1